MQLCISKPTIRSCRTRVCPARLFALPALLLALSTMAVGQTRSLQAPRIEIVQYNTGYDQFLGVPSTFIAVGLFDKRSYYAPVTFDVQFDSVPEATIYRLDIAEDSLFTRILPGLRNYTEVEPFSDCYLKRSEIDRQLFPRIAYYTANCNPRFPAWRVAYLLQGKRYYARMKAFSPVAESPYSSIASVTAVWSKNIQVGESISRSRVLSAQIRHLTDTSVSFALFRRNNVAVEAGVNISRPLITNLDEITLSGLRQRTENTVTLIGGNFQGTSFIDTLRFRIRPFSSDMARFGKIISYYEGPTTPTSIGSEQLYFFKSMGRSTNLTAVEDSLRLLQRRGIVIDTAWFNTGGFVTCTGFAPLPPCSEFDTAFHGLLIKLKQPDARIQDWGDRTGVVRQTPIGYEFALGTWRFSDEAVYYRFDFNGITSVKQAQDVSDKAALRVYPNPLHKSSDIRYILPIAGTVRVEIHDIVGRTVFSQPAEWRNAGEHEIPFDASGLAPGTYLVRCTISNGRSVQHLTAHYLVLP